MSVNNIPQEKLMKILLGLKVTEKAALLSQHRKYVFKVISEANKLLIKQAVELLFNVKVDAVRVTNVKAKVKRFGRMEGKRKGWKKAYVKLSEGYTIDLMSA